MTFPCAFEHCASPATHKAGGAVFFPLCDEHAAQVAPDTLCSRCQNEGSDIEPDGLCPSCHIYLAPDTCYATVETDTAGEVVSVCHRRAGHVGDCSDWSPDECLVPECACTEVEA